MSEIARDDTGCNIFEHFHAGSGQAMSVSFFNADAGKWFQTYIDDAGGRILLGGSLVDGAMVLVTPGTTRFGRITWSVVGAGVRQLGEATVDEGATWTTTFDGMYARR